MASELASMYNTVLHRRSEVPSAWKSAKIAILFKKGDKKQPDNYRPICIIPLLYKLFNKILLKRIHKTLNDAQSRDQPGFRPTYSCEDHLFTVLMITETLNECGKPLWIATIDFKKTFDSTSHESIWKALEKQGVHRQYTKLLQSMYKGQNAKVQTDVTSRLFNISRGTKQGDPISPLLFNAVVEALMRDVKEKWAKKGWGGHLGWGVEEK